MDRDSSGVSDLVTGASDARVWVTVVDPDSSDGQLAMKAWDHGLQSEWAVPGAANPDDFVLAWLTGGTGFKYLLTISGSLRKPAKDEFGPQQANLHAQQRIDPPVSMMQLKADPVVASWWLVRSSMQGVVRAQRESLTRNHEWAAFLDLLSRVAPATAATLRRRLQTYPTQPGLDVPPHFSTVTFVDEGSTAPVRLTVMWDLGNVFARAAAINEGRDGFDLSFSSLLLGIYYGQDPLGKWMAEYFVEQGINVEHALSKVRRDTNKASAAAERAVNERDAILLKPLRRTVSARRALDEALTIAEAHGVARIDTRHVVAAMIGLTDYHEEDFGALALDRARWGAAFVTHLALNSYDTDEIAFWRRFYERRFPGHELPRIETPRRVSQRPDYDADAYSARDLLSIDDEVAALASVIASRQTQPPLAIGLFGDWGSGKTFFMKHLRRRIDRLCHGALEQKPAARECHAHIAQIEFNAWHYQEGDLWASLVDHILRNLRFGEDEDDARVAERRDQMVRDLAATEARQQAAAGRATAADERVGKAEQRVLELKDQERIRREELAQTLTPVQIFTAARTSIRMDDQLRQRGEELGQVLGINLAGTSAVDFRDALLEARRELSGISAFLLPLLRAQDRWVRGALLAVALVTPLTLAFVVNSLLGQTELVAKIGAVVVGVGSFLATATAWIDRQMKWVRSIRARVEPVAQAVTTAVDAGIEQALSEHKASIANKLAEIDSLRQEQASALKERDEAAAQAAALKSTLATLGDDGLMRAFLDERIGGGVYQQKLGIAALIRRDFERLSRKMLQVTEREYQDKLDGSELVINRIVLYIDDLDRCEMEKVVPVLRAVHLLLAFPAFVVVVGVDSRWVARCVARHLSMLADLDDSDTAPAATPLDYLEKIFQIPIWLEPVSESNRVRMAQTLLRKPVVVERGPTRPQKPAMEDEKPASPAAPAPDRAKMAADAGGSPKEQTVPSEAPPKENEGPPLDLNPPGLSITDAEYTFIRELGSLLSSSPRVLKRFVNTYRLMNATIAQISGRDLKRNPEIRMLLLAVLVGMPELSGWLQNLLGQLGPENLSTPLVDLVDAARKGRAPDRAAAQWEQVRLWIHTHPDPWATVPSYQFAALLNQVGRYTFNLSR